MNDVTIKIITKKDAEEILKKIEELSRLLTWAQTIDVPKGFQLEQDTQYGFKIVRKKKGEVEC